MAVTSVVRPDLREQAAHLLADGVRACTAYGRPEAARRLAHRRDRLAEPDVRVVIIGEFKAGKSTLINAVLGADHCPTDDDVATAIPTIVRSGDPPAATALSVADGEISRTAIPFESRAEAIRGEHGDDGFTAIELAVPHPLLSLGIELVDTPGVGGLRSAHGAAAVAAVGDAEAVVFVTDAGRELTGAELDTLREIAAQCPNLLIALTKCDLYPTWRRILELDEQHLDRAGIEAPIIPLSAPLRRLALELDDPAIDAESGYAELLAILADDVAGQAVLLAVDQAVHELLSAVDSLIAAFETERASLTDPDLAAANAARLTAAAERAEALKAASSRWQTVLNDGLADLTADVDHDLRVRMRHLTADATERIEELDPRQSWDEFATWLEQAMAEAVLANRQLLHERAAALAARVVADFEGEQARLDTGDDNAAPPVEAAGQLGELDLTSASLVSSVLGGLRGSYSGLMMFGMLGGLAGVAVATPVLAGLGLLLGTKQVREERAKQRKAHRQQAQQSVRKYVEEASLVATKASRDAVKAAQRTIRDHCLAEAKAAQERVKELLAAVREAEAASDVGHRLRDIDAELARLRGFRADIEAMTEAMACD